MAQEPKDILEFAAGLGVDLYDWQADICLTIEQAAALMRKKIAVASPNGVGKTQRIIPLSALRWLQRFPKGRVRITSKDSKQIADQLWPALKAHAPRFPAWRYRDHEHIIDTPQSGRLRGFSTDEGARVEGAHADPDAPLLIIVDEAKSVDPEIIQAIDRCGYNVLVYISSPWVKQGPFYDAFTVNSDSFITFQIGVKDCPHIPAEKIKDVIDTYGEHHPFTRSTIYGEFVDFGDGVTHVLDHGDIDRWIASTVNFIPGPTIFALDFAAGGDDNVHSQTFW